MNCGLVTEAAKRAEKIHNGGTELTKTNEEETIKQKKLKRISKQFEPSSFVSVYFVSP